MVKWKRDGVTFEVGMTPEENPREDLGKDEKEYESRRRSHQRATQEKMRRVLRKRWEETARGDVVESTRK